MIQKVPKYFSVREETLDEDSRMYMKQCKNNSKFLREAITEKIHRESTINKPKENVSINNVDTELLLELKNMITALNSNNGTDHEVVEAFTHLDGKIEHLINMVSNMKTSEPTNNDSVLNSLENIEMRLMNKMKLYNESVVTAISNTTVNGEKVIVPVEKTKEQIEDKTDFEINMANNVSSFAFTKK